MRIISLLLALFVPSLVEAEELTPAQILKSISAHGARETVGSLHESGTDWYVVVQQVSAGDPAYLAVAEALRPGTDAGASSELNIAVFIALARSPLLVLGMLRDTQVGAGAFSVRFVCSSNIGIDFPADDSRRMIRERITILEKLHGGEETARDSCLSALRTALYHFDE